VSHDEVEDDEGDDCRCVVFEGVNKGRASLFEHC
jgi:hypothetical protein